jgi:hypothetical protein
MSLTDSLSAYWKLDEASGTREDSHGANDLTDNNTVGSTTGKLNTAGSFIAANSEYLSIADNATLSFDPATPFTFSAWVYLQSKVVDRTIGGSWNFAGADRSFIVYYQSSSDRFRFEISADGSTSGVSINADSLGSPATGTWYFVVAWHDYLGGFIAIQVNNGTVDQASWLGGTRNTASPFILGANGTGTGAFWNGRIDEVGYWVGDILTASERTQLYNGGAGLAYPFPVSATFSADVMTATASAPSATSVTGALLPAATSAAAASMPVATLAASAPGAAVLFGAPMTATASAPVAVITTTPAAPRLWLRHVRAPQRSLALATDHPARAP